MLVALLLCSWSSVVATTLHTEVKANPIRKIVTLLQDMQKEIEAEGAKEKGLFDKFMCYCDGNTDGMSKAAEAAGQEIIQLQSKLESEEAEHSQLTQELAQHRQDREAAKNDLATATSIREKEHADYEADVGDKKQNLDAMTGAIAALEKGMGANAFVQMSRDGMSRLRACVRSTSQIEEDQKDGVLAFLQGKQNPFGDYSGQSGEIVGMLKAMKDEMDKDLKGAVSAEEASQTGFDELAAAKQSEISAATEAIESKTVRAGKLAVSVVTTKDDIEDTTAEMKETEAFLANLSAQCATKKQEWDERSKVRAEEVSAISQAIAVLNDDDALDLFKKTVSLAQSSNSMGFLQRNLRSSPVTRAHNMIVSLAQKGTSEQSQLSLIAYALKAKKVDFSKVLAMIDGMSAHLTKEQEDDDASKAFCEKDFARTAQEKKDTETAIASSEALIAETKDASVMTAQEIDTLNAEVKALDKAVAEATEQRKEEHADFLTYQTESSAAVQLVEKAKNKLFKFYRPNQYKEAPKRELTDEERILASSGRSDMIATQAPEMIAGTQQTVFVEIKSKATPPPPPDTWDAYQKKDGKSNGVIALMDMMLKDLKADITDAEHEEETSQKDYERMMSQSQKNRATNVESITNKEASKADLDMTVENAQEKKTGQEAELMNLNEYISNLHGQCDFIVENYDLRKAARSNERESLKNAKAVLSGADFA